MIGNSIEYGQEVLPMPWKDIRPMDQKTRLIGDWLGQEYSISEISQTYAVSRKTVHKWINRYKEGGPAALEELSHIPHTNPNATSQEIVDRIITEKLKHRYWGPKKIVAWLRRHHPEDKWPAASTAGHILKKENLVNKRPIRHHTPPYTEPFQSCSKPNDVWSMDYKGKFRMLDTNYCYPFTLTDNYSRYLLACQGLLHPDYENTRPCLELAFREYGLPLAIRSDNGTPFATVGLGGISRLSAWLIKLWIRPERIEPGHPEQNPRHERMHRCLKEETTKPPKANLKQQQKAFDRFRSERNNERPHEALGLTEPASHYVASRRVFPDRIPEIEYASCYTVRLVRSNGSIKWGGEQIYVSRALEGEPIGLKQISEREWLVMFSFFPLGIFNEIKGGIIPMPKEYS
jgi:putative transposase